MFKICKNCNKKFSSIKTCKRHIEKRICLKVVQKKWQKIKQNMKICERCGLVLSNQYSLIKHSTKQVPCIKKELHLALLDLQKEFLNNDKIERKKFLLKKEVLCEKIGLAHSISFSLKQKPIINIDYKNLETLSNEELLILFKEHINSMNKMSDWIDNAWDLLKELSPENINMNELINTLDNDISEDNISNTEIKIPEIKSNIINNDISEYNISNTKINIPEIKSDIINNDISEYNISNTEIKIPEIKSNIINNDISEYNISNTKINIPEIKSDIINNDISEYNISNTEIKIPEIKSDIIINEDNISNTEINIPEIKSNIINNEKKEICLTEVIPNLIKKEQKEWELLFKEDMNPIFNELDGHWNTDNYIIKPVRHYSDYYNRALLVRNMKSSKMLSSIICPYFYPKYISSLDTKVYININKKNSMWLLDDNKWKSVSFSIGIQNMVFHAVSAYIDIIRRERELLPEESISKWIEEQASIENHNSENYRLIVKNLISRIPKLLIHPEEEEINLIQTYLKDDEYKIDILTEIINEYPDYFSLPVKLQDSVLYQRIIQTNRFKNKLEKAKILHQEINKYYESI